MKDFVFHNSTKIIFGKSAMGKIHENVAPFGNKVLLTYGGGSIKRNGIYQMAIKQLKGFDVYEFGGIEPNPRVETIRKALSKFKNNKPDFILAVGGGSVVDGSKLLSASFYYDGDPWDFVTNNPEPEKYVPLGVILTLSATGSEMNAGAVITHYKTKEKQVFVRSGVRPKFSILDPKNTFSVPKDQTAYGIIDAYSHVLEQYINTSKNTPLQDRFSESILLTLIENAPKVLKDPKNYNARANIMLCATMALNDLISLGVNEDWATHVIEHQLSAFYDIPHAAGLAIITPRWMQVTKDQKKEKLVQYGRRIFALDGNEDEIIDKAIKNTYDFFNSLGVKMSLSAWKITSKYFDQMTKRLVRTKIGEFPLTKTQIRKILDTCL